MTQIKGTWGYAFNAFPGIEPTRGWGGFADGDNAVQLPNGAVVGVVALFLMKATKLRFQLPLGTPAGQFPARITITGRQSAASFALPGRRQTFGNSEARDYELVSERPLGKLVDVETAIAFGWDETPAAEPEPEPEREEREREQRDSVARKIAAYDPERHTLLRDVAHTEYLTADEYPEFEARLRALGVEVIRVQISEWAKVPYTPLAIVNNIDGGSTGSAWWTKHFWTGQQPAVVTQNWIRYTYPDRPDIAAAMAPGMAGVEHNVRVDTVARYEGRVMAGDEFAPKRLAYREQVQQFSSAEHVLVRPWLRDRGLDPVEFYRDFLPELVGVLEFNPVFEVSNPQAKTEKAQTGAFSIAADAVAVDHVDAVLGEFAARSSGRPARRPAPGMQPPTSLPPQPPPRPDRPNAVIEGCKVYSLREAAQALHNAFGFMPDLWRGSPSDLAIVATTRAGLQAFLDWSQVDKLAYVADEGGRNFVCDDFATRLKSDLAMYFNLNGCAVVGGNGHAWCLFFIVGDDGKCEAVLVEPQNDQFVVGELRGIYGIDRICELYL